MGSEDFSTGVRTGNSARGIPRYYPPGVAIPDNVDDYDDTPPEDRAEKAARKKAEASAPPTVDQIVSAYKVLDAVKEHHTKASPAVCSLLGDAARILQRSLH